jgi:putative transposase
MNQLYRAIGISKQAVMQYASRQLLFDERIRCLLAEAQELRQAHPGCGVEKMYDTLAPDFIGRDRFVDLFIQLGFRLRKAKNYRRTTYAGTINYPNLIKGLYVDRPSLVWQSDITYIHVAGRFYYAVFILDVYTRKIVGYQISDHMRATANINALKMALKEHAAPQIHHSDRGSQFGYKPYLELLQQNGCSISMAQSAQDNAYAERINRTIKEEYLDHWKPKTYLQLKNGVAKAVKNYNNKRIHQSLGKQSPVNVQNAYFQDRLAKLNGFTIFDNSKPS